MYIKINFNQLVIQILIKLKWSKDEKIVKSTFKK